MKKFVLVFIFLITSCQSTNIIELVDMGPNAIPNAENEIRNYSYDTKYISEERYLALLDEANNAIYDSAVWFCNQYSPSPEKCTNFKFEYIGDSSFNAYATEEDGSYKVVVHTGIFQHVSTIEEVAFIVAHELAHHISNHIDFSKRNINIGEVVGSVIGMAIAGSIVKGRSQDTIRSALDIGSNIGEAAGSIGGEYFYSAEQELEADFTAMFILRNAWLDLNIARYAILKTSKTSKMSEKFLQSHPSGPRRLASFDHNLRRAKNEHYKFIGDLEWDPDCMTPKISCQELRDYDLAVQDGYFERMHEAVNKDEFIPVYELLIK
jgi:predicted Zn-dependent protease